MRIRTPHPHSTLRIRIRTPHPAPAPQRPTIPGRADARSRWAACNCAAAWCPKSRKKTISAQNDRIMQFTHTERRRQRKCKSRERHAPKRRQSKVARGTGGRRARRRLRTRARLAQAEGKRRFLEGLTEVCEPGMEFARHGRDPRRITPAVLLSHFGVSYAEGYVRARERFDELVGLSRSSRSGERQ